MVKIGNCNLSYCTSVAEDDFGILLATAHYDTIGAVTIKPVLP